MEVVSPCNKDIEIYCDSQSSIELAGSEGINLRAKHIDVAYQFVRDVFSHREVHLE